MNNPEDRQQSQLASIIDIAVGSEAGRNERYYNQDLAELPRNLARVLKAIAGGIVFPVRTELLREIWGSSNGEKATVVAGSILDALVLIGVISLGQNGEVLSAIGVKALYNMIAAAVIFYLREYDPSEE